MNKLQFGTFMWPENPQQYEVHMVCEPVYTKTEDDTVIFSGMGPVKRTITGKGVFVGSDADNHFMALADLMNQTAPTMLIHPQLGECSAYLTELTATQEARGAYVAYSFTFREADSSDAIPR